MSNKKLIETKYSPEEVFKNFSKLITFEMKLAFICTFVIGVIVHFQYLANNFMNEDMVGRQIYSAIFYPYAKQGRWAAVLPSSTITSYYTVQALIGFLAIFWMSLFSMITIHLLKIKRKINIFLSSMLIIAFPTIAYASCYVTFFDTLCASIFFGAGAVFCVENIKGKKGVLIASFLLMFSMAIYQQSLGTAMMICILILFNDLLDESVSDKQIKDKIIRFIVFGITGGILYFISIKISGLFIPLSSYKGLNTMGSADLFLQLPSLILKAYGSFAAFFVGLKFFYVSKTVMVCYFLILLMGAVLLCNIIKSKKLQKNKFRLFLIFVLILATPLSVNIIDVVSVDSDSYTLTVYNMVLCFVLCIKLLDTGVGLNIKKINTKNWIVTVTVFIVAFHYCVLDNIYYLKANTYTQRSYALSNRILSKMEELEGFRSDATVMVLGSLPNYNYPAVKNQFEHIKDDVGLRNAFVGYPQTSTYKRNSQKFFSTMNQYFGMNFQYLENDVYDEIQKRQEYMEMGVWPAEDSIGFIDDIAVVNLKYPARVKSSINENGTIHFELENREVFETGYKFAFRVYKNAEVIHATKYSQKEDYFDLDVTGPGEYYVRVYVKDENGVTVESSMISDIIEIK